MALIPMFKSLFDMEEVSLNDVMKFQRNLVAPHQGPICVIYIYKRLDEKDLESFFKTVLTYPLNVKSELIAILPEWMKKVLRKMLSAVMR